MEKMHTSIDPRIIEAEENLLIDIHFLLQETMSAKGVSRSHLAEKAKISKARLSQILSTEANPTVKSVARLFHALGETVCVSRKECRFANDGAPPNPQKESGWHWTKGKKGSPIETRADDRLVEVIKKSNASNDNSVLFIDSEVALAPELEAA